jgi:hypothetical protein
MEEEELDVDWIREFEETDELYKDYYKDDVFYIRLRFVYVNRRNEIEKVEEDSHLMSQKNRLSRDEMKSVIDKHRLANYRVASVLKYNLTMGPDELETAANSYLTAIGDADAVEFEQTINSFQDMNELLIVFQEKSKTRAHHKIDMRRLTRRKN